MDTEKDAENVDLSDPISEPPLLVSGKGSGSDSDVGNNEKKKKIFFFGQPGCLKHSPLKVAPTENHNNHNTAAESSSTSNDDEKMKPEIEKVKKLVEYDDDDEDSLLQKISEALEDEPNLKADKQPESGANVSPSSDNFLIGTDETVMKVAASENKIISTTTPEADCETSKEIKHDSQLINEEKLENNENKKVVEKCAYEDELEDNEKISSGSGCVKTDEPDNLIAPLKTSDQVSVQNQPFSIVPYDEDSTSSTSQVESEKEKEKLESEEKPEDDKSASLIPESNDFSDSKVSENVEENLMEEEIKTKVVSDLSATAVENIKIDKITATEGDSSQTAEPTEIITEVAHENCTDEVVTDDFPEAPSDISEEKVEVETSMSEVEKNEQSVVGNISNNEADNHTLINISSEVIKNENSKDVPDHALASMDEQCIQSNEIQDASVKPIKKADLKAPQYELAYETPPQIGNNVIKSEDALEKVSESSDKTPSETISSVVEENESIEVETGEDLTTSLLEKEQQEDEGEAEESFTEDDRKSLPNETETPRDEFLTEITEKPVEIETEPNLEETSLQKNVSSQEDEENTQENISLISTTKSETTDEPLELNQTQSPHDQREHLLNETPETSESEPPSDEKYSTALQEEPESIQEKLQLEEVAAEEENYFETKENAQIIDDEVSIEKNLVDNQPTGTVNCESTSVNEEFESSSIGPQPKIIEAVTKEPKDFNFTTHDTNNEETIKLSEPDVEMKSIISETLTQNNHVEPLPSTSLPKTNTLALNFSSEFTVVEPALVISVNSDAQCSKVERVKEHLNIEIDAPLSKLEAFQDVESSENFKHELIKHSYIDESEPTSRKILDTESLPVTEMTTADEISQEILPETSATCNKPQTQLEEESSLVEVQDNESVEVFDKSSIMNLSQPKPSHILDLSKTEVKPALNQETTDDIMVSSVQDQEIMLDLSEKKADKVENPKEFTKHLETESPPSSPEDYNDYDNAEDDFDKSDDDSEHSLNIAEHDESKEIDHKEMILDTKVIAENKNLSYQSNLAATPISLESCNVEASFDPNISKRQDEECKIKNLSNDVPMSLSAVSTEKTREEEPVDETKINQSKVDDKISTQLEAAFVASTSTLKEIFPQTSVPFSQTLSQNNLFVETPISQNITEEIKVVENEAEVNKTPLLDLSQSTLKPLASRKRKISERKSISESDSEGNIATDSMSHENSSEDEETVLKKKPRMRGKTSSPRKVPVTRKLPARKSVAEKPVEQATVAVADEKLEEQKVPTKPLESTLEESKATLEESEAVMVLPEIKTNERLEEQNVETKVLEESKETPLIQEIKTKEEENKSNQTLQNLQFDYDANDDIAANVAAIKTMICKEPKKESSSEDDESERKTSVKRGRKGKRGRFNKRNDAESSSDEDSFKKTSRTDSKRTKTEETNDTSPTKKKRETGPKGLLKHLDTSLVIDTTENEAPVRQSRRIAQQKIREETERRQMEEKLLKQMKAEADKKKKDPNDLSEEEYEEEEQKDSSADDESFKGTPRKKKSKINAADKQWQTSSSHSEHSESDEYLEHVHSDPGSPLFKSDHEFSPESDDDDATQVQPLKRARTAKKLETVASSDNEEDINPNHACQVCHKTDSPEWILLCDDCDCGYHCSCLKPIIFLIPSGNWYCPLCCHKKLIDSLSVQLTSLDTLIHNIETIELRQKRQKLLEISEQNILQERRKNRLELEASRESTPDSKESSGSTDSDSDAPLKDYFYKLRKRNQTAAPSYRFNEYDALINSAIKKEMDEVKGAGNLGRGKDIATIIEADSEEKEKQEENQEGGDEVPPAVKNDDAESSGSDVVRPKKSMKRKKKNRKLNNLDVSSEGEQESDEDFKGSSPSSDSEVDEEDLSMSSVSESSLDLPSKKGKKGQQRSLRVREKRVDRRFINDNSDDSDDVPLIRAKRSKKKDSDEEEFDMNDEDDEEGSLAEEIDSEDLCDDTETDSSSGGNWPKKKKKRVASYDIKPRKAPKKPENEDKAFRAGISKKKILKKSDNESEASASETEKGRRKTRGKKLLYLIEDDLDSDESDGIKPGVKRPETPPEEREMFVKKQEEIKRMLAAKDTEAAKKLAAPTIQPINIAMAKPNSPSPIPFSNEPASLSTIPKNVIESAKALDTDYNRIKPSAFGQSRGIDGSLQSIDMNEEELARMMEEEDFAQHQLKLAGEAIARKKLADLEAKEEEFAAFTKANRDKDWAAAVSENKKRNKKSKISEKSGEEAANFSKALTSQPQILPTNLSTSTMPPLLSSNMPPQLPKTMMQHQPSIIASLMQHQQQSFIPNLPHLTSDRPTVLSSFTSRPDMLPQHMKPDMLAQHMKPEMLPQHMKPEMLAQHMKPEMLAPHRKPELLAQHMKPEMLPQHMKPEILAQHLKADMLPHLMKQDIHPQHLKIHQPIPPEAFNPKLQPVPPQALEDSDDRKKGRRKKFTPLRTDLPEGNISKLAKLDPPSVIQTAAADRVEDKSKVPRPDHPKLSVAAPPQIFNPNPSVITRLLQPQQPRPGSGPFPSGFTEVTHGSAENPNIRMFATQEEMKNAAQLSKSRGSMPQGPLGASLPQSSFGDHPFGPRSMHPLYRGPPAYGIPPHARLPPYPFHHLAANLRPAAPYNIPPQFSYYAPPAHSRQHPQSSAIPLNHGASQLVAGNEDISNSIRNANNSEEPSETSEFGGLVSYFSSQQELD